MNGIEKDLGERAKVIRLNLMSKVGKEAARRYDVRAIPTIVVLDGAQKVIYRHTGLPNRSEVVAQVMAH